LVKRRGIEQVRRFTRHVREADLEVIDWKIAAYQAAEDGIDPPPREPLTTRKT
jgi:hypothetical protein